MDSDTTVSGLAHGMSNENGVQEQFPVVGEEITLGKVSGFSTDSGNASSNGNTEILAKVEDKAVVTISSIEIKPDASNSVAESVDLNVLKTPGLKEANQLKVLKPKIQGKCKDEKPSSLPKSVTMGIKKVNDRKGVAFNPSNGDLALNAGLKRCSVGERSKTTNDRQGICSNAKPSPAVNSPRIAKQSLKPEPTSIATKSDGEKEKTKLKPSGNASINQAEGSIESNSPTATDAKSVRVGALPAYNFSFKCNERAEKRREFYSKLEEKIHAKEAEKTNLQAKSKESQEAELRRLRKSLTFKATPMPRFYQEPVPPKMELKKIPTTRAKSPKLGRKKDSPTRDTGGDGAFGHQPVRSSFDERSLNHNATKDIPTFVKKPQRKSLPKLPSEKTILSKQANEAACQKGTLPTNTNKTTGDESCLIEQVRDITISAKMSLKESEKDDMPVIEDQNPATLEQEPILFEN